MADFLASVDGDEINDGKPETSAITSVVKTTSIGKVDLQSRMPIFQSNTLRGKPTTNISGSSITFCKSKQQHNQFVKTAESSNIKGFVSSSRMGADEVQKPVGLILAAKPGRFGSNSIRSPVSRFGPVSTSIDTKSRFSSRFTSAEVSGLSTGLQNHEKSKNKTVPVDNFLAQFAKTMRERQLNENNSSSSEQKIAHTTISPSTTQDTSALVTQEIDRNINKHEDNKSKDLGTTSDRQKQHRDEKERSSNLEKKKNRSCSRSDSSSSSSSRGGRSRSRRRSHRGRRQSSRKERRKHSRERRRDYNRNRVRDREKSRNRSRSRSRNRSRKR